MFTYDKEIKFITKKIKQAYKKFIKRNNNIITHPKGYADYVTESDIKVEKFLIEQIKKQFPNDNFVSEEFNSKAKIENRCWIIDPIDGTINYFHKIPIWCIQIAFVDNKECQFSVIYIPAQNEIYTATSDGAFVNGKKIVNKNNFPLEQSILTLCDLAHSEPKSHILEEQILSKLNKKILRTKRLGSCGCEFAYVASGRTQCYISISPHPWDWLPGKFLCEKAGVSTYEYVWGKQTFKIACSSPELAKNLLDLLEKTNYKK